MMSFHEEPFGPKHDVSTWRNNLWCLQILNPTDITMYSSTPTGQGMHIAINLSDIIMNVSPATIRQVTATLSSMTAPPVSIV